MRNVNLIKNVILKKCAAAVVLCAAASAAYADPTNLVQNGTFASVSGSGPTNGLDSVFNRDGSPSYTYSLTDWTYYSSRSRNNGFSAVLTPGAATTTGFAADGMTFNLWDSTSPNPPGGGPGTIPTNPPSGPNNIWMSDGDSENQSTLGQTISGLVPGAMYNVTFNYAAAQLRGYNNNQYNGATNDAWEVNLGGTIGGTAPNDNEVQGGTTLVTPELFIASHDFSGWYSASLTFTATAAMENLFFTAFSTSQGLPPQALLDDVSLTAVPEPSTLAIMGIGLAGVGFAAYRRRARIRALA